MSEVKKIATREAYGEALAELGESYPNLVVLDADLASATKTGVFQKKFPDRHVDCGIAEANMMGIAAGLSLTGKIPVASTFAMFAAGRAFEQVRKSVYGRYVTVFESIEGVASSMLSNAFLGLSLYDLCDATAAVTLEEVNKLLQTQFTPSRSAISIVNPIRG